MSWAVTPEAWCKSSGVSEEFAALVMYPDDEV